MMRSEYLSQLHKLLDTRFDNEELHILCFDLGVDYDDLAGQGQAGKALALVNYCDRHDLILKLVEVGHRQRPDIEWPEPPPPVLSATFEPTSRPQDNDLDRRNQLTLLKKVYASWIDGVLTPTIQRCSRFRVGVDVPEGTNAYPWPMIMRSADAPPRSLESGTRIYQVFTAAQEGLLILGAPGSGKTTMLLDLACDLIAEAEQDETRPLRVIFNLSSWAAERPTLATWVTEELQRRYDIPHAIAQVWVEENRILPLLDALDEVQAEHRSACVQAINVFQRDHNSVSIVLCSRAADYEALAARLNLTEAVVLQPLTPEYIDAYLSAAGSSLAPLRERMANDVMLHEMAQSPLLLNLMTLAYQDVQVAALPLASEIEQRRLQVVRDYVHRIVKIPMTNTPYSPAQLTRWLTWLAKAMDQRADWGYSWGS